MSRPPASNRAGLCLAVVLAIQVFARPVISLADPAFDSISQQVRDVFERCRDAVVKIEAVDPQGHLCGTGFFVDPNGTLYTSYTIGGESHDIVISQGDKKWTASRLLADPRSGIAVLKVEARTPYLPLGKTDALRVASPVMTVGFPMDMPGTPHFGVVGGFDIKHQDRYFAATHIRANVPVQRGEGGSPLLNMNGEVLGILISCVDSGAGCFVLPIEAAEKVRRDFMRFGEVRPGWLGISLRETPNEVEGSNLRVDELIPGAPAEKRSGRARRCWMPCFTSVPATRCRSPWPGTGKKSR
jgi:serine protease Do